MYCKSEFDLHTTNLKDDQIFEKIDEDISSEYQIPENDNSEDQLNILTNYYTDLIGEDGEFASIITDDDSYFSKTLLQAQDLVRLLKTYFRNDSRQRKVTPMCYMKFINLLVKLQEKCNESITAKSFSSDFASREDEMMVLSNCLKMLNQLFFELSHNMLEINNFNEDNKFKDARDDKNAFKDNFSFEDYYFLEQKNVYSANFKLFNSMLFLKYIQQLDRFIKDLRDDSVNAQVFRNEYQSGLYLMQVLKQVTQFILDSYDSKFQVANQRRVKDAAVKVVESIFLTIKDFSSLGENLKSQMQFIYDQVLLNDIKTKYFRTMVEVMKASLKGTEKYLLMMLFFEFLDEMATQGFTEEKISSKQKCIRRLLVFICESKELELKKSLVVRQIRNLVAKWLVKGGKHQIVRQMALNMSAVVVQITCCMMIENPNFTELRNEVPNLNSVQETFFQGILRRVEDDNNFVRNRALQILHQLAECQLNSLGIESDQYIETMTNESYYFSFAKICSRIHDSSVFNVHSAIKCVTSLMNNNKLFNRIQHEQKELNTKSLDNLSKQFEDKIKEVSDRPEDIVREISRIHHLWLGYQDDYAKVIANLESGGLQIIEAEDEDEDPENEDNAEVQQLNFRYMEERYNFILGEYKWNSLNANANTQASYYFTQFMLVKLVRNLTFHLENLILPENMRESSIAVELKESFNTSKQYENIKKMGLIISLINGKNLSLRTAGVELIRAGMRFNVLHQKDIAVHQMLPLVFDDTSKKVKKNDEEVAPRDNNNDDNEFAVGGDQQELPIKDVVVITIFQHWFGINLNENQDLTRQQVRNDLTHKLFKSLRTNVEKYIKDTTMHRYLVEIFSHVLTKFPIFKKLMDRSILHYLNQNIKNLAEKGIEFIQNRIPYLINLQNRYTLRNINELTENDTKIKLALGNLVRPNTQPINEIKDLIVSEELSGEDLRMIHQFVNHNYDQIEADVESILIIIEAHRNAGVTMESAGDNHKDRFVTIDVLFTLAQRLGSLPLAEIAMKLGQQVEIKDRAPNEPIDWNMNTEYMEWMRKLNEISNFLCNWVEKFAEVEDEEQLYDPHIENALNLQIILLKSKMNKQKDFVTSAVNLVKSLQYIHLQHNCMLALHLAAHVLACTAMRQLECIQDSIDKFEANYSKAEKDKPSLTEEDKATGIIEDRKNILDKNLRTNYIADFLGKFNETKPRNTKTECYPILYKISLQDFDELNILGSNSQQQAQPFRMTIEELKADSPGVKQMQFCAQWVGRMESFNNIWKFATDVGRLMLMDQDYCRAHMQFLIWLLLAQEEITLQEQETRRETNRKLMLQQQEQIAKTAKTNKTSLTKYQMRNRKKAEQTTIQEEADQLENTKGEQSINNDLANGFNKPSEKEIEKVDVNLTVASEVDEYTEEIMAFQNEMTEAYRIIKSHEQLWHQLQLSLIQIVGDFQKRFPGLITPFTNQVMEVLCCKNAEVRTAAVHMVSHLHSSKTIRDNGSITVLAFLHNEVNKNVNQTVNTFFMELINTTGAEDVLLNTVIPDVTTKFTDILFYINNAEHIRSSDFKNLNLYTILYKKQHELQPTLRTEAHFADKDKNERDRLAKEKLEKFVLQEFKHMIQWLISLAEEHIARSEERKNVAKFYNQIIIKFCERFKSFTKNDESDKYIFRVLAYALKELVKQPTDVTIVANKKDLWREKASKDKEVQDCFKFIADSDQRKRNTEQVEQLESRRIIARECESIQENVWKKKDVQEGATEQQMNHDPAQRPSGVVLDTQYHHPRPSNSDRDSNYVMQRVSDSRDLDSSRANPRRNNRRRY